MDRASRTPFQVCQAGSNLMVVPFHGCNCHEDNRAICSFLSLRSILRHFLATPGTGCITDRRVLVVDNRCSTNNIVCAEKLATDEEGSPSPGYRTHIKNPFCPFRSVCAECDLFPVLDAHSNTHHKRDEPLSAGDGSPPPSPGLARAQATLIALDHVGISVNMQMFTLSRCCCSACVLCQALTRTNRSPPEELMIVSVVLITLKLMYAFLYCAALSRAAAKAAEAASKLDGVGEHFLFFVCTSVRVFALCWRKFNQNCPNIIPVRNVKMRVRGCVQPQICTPISVTF